MSLCVIPTSVAKSVKIRGYVTTVKSPTEFEIDDYRITREATLVLEFEKSDDPEELTTFNPSGIRVGTEMEIRGELDEGTGQLSAKSIKVNLEENQRVKRTALMETAPEIVRTGKVWQGQIHADGRRDLPVGDPQKIPFQFFVVDQKVPNAFALPNGTVVLNSGMLTMLENQAQLAAVMGHEIAHAVQEHSYRQSQYHKKALMALRIGGAIGAAYGGRGIADLANLTEAAIRNGYSRSLENQADRVGTGYMMAAGYDPREAARVWKVMALKGGDHPTNLFWSTHDNHTARRSYLMSELMNNYGGVNFESYKRDDPRFAKAAEALNTLYSPKKKLKVKY